jgi:hypothetical protein
MKEYQKIRIEICKVCPSNTLNICRKCGCFVTFKAMVKNQECPMGKWSTEV